MRVHLRTKGFQLQLVQPGAVPFLQPQVTPDDKERYRNDSYEEKHIIYKRPNAAPPWWHYGKGHFHRLCALLPKAVDAVCFQLVVARRQEVVLQLMAFGVLPVVVQPADAVTVAQLAQA